MPPSYEISGPAGTLAGWWRPAQPQPRRQSQSQTALDLPAIVLLHGLHQSSEHWAGLGSRLPAERAVLAPEVRGHGSSGRAGPHGLSHYADDVLCAIDAHGLDRVHLVGTSFGSSVAVAVAALLGARATSILAFGGARHTGKGRDVGEVVAAVRRHGVRGFFSFTVPRFTLPPGTPQSVVDAHVDAVVAGRDEDTVAAIFEGTYGTDVADWAAEVRCPALVVSGALDQTCPPPSGRGLAGVLGAPHEVLDGVAHVPALECPDTVAAIVLRHIDAVEGVSVTR